VGFFRRRDSSIVLYGIMDDGSIIFKFPRKIKVEADDKLFEKASNSFSEGVS